MINYNYMSYLKISILSSLLIITSSALIDYTGKNWPSSCNSSKGSPIDIPNNAMNSTDYVRIVSLNYQRIADISWELLNSNAFYLDLSGLTSYLMLVENRTTYKYNLQGINLHVPAEHTIMGSTFDMELQLVHTKDTDWLLNQGILNDPDSNSSNLIISILYLSGSNDTNSVIEDFNFATFGSAIGYFDLNLLFNPLNNFYFYEGSLTIPNCDQTVNWVVISEIQAITSDQLSIINSLVRKVYPLGNARKLQALNSRPVYYIAQGGNSDNLNFSMIVLALAVLFLIFFFKKKFDIM